tara:strand:+ start:292 stop:543 length:252 start_codon:yes stop_codon:yes gene_type:complete
MKNFKGDIIFTQDITLPSEMEPNGLAAVKELKFEYSDVVDCRVGIGKEWFNYYMLSKGTSMDYIRVKFEDMRRLYTEGIVKIK